MKLIPIFLSALLIISCSTVAPPSAGRSLADNKLSLDILKQLDRIERAYALYAKDAPGANGASNMRGAKVVDRKVTSKPDSKGVWKEAWTVLRDAGYAIYTVTYIPTPGIGGTDFGIKAPPRLTN